MSSSQPDLQWPTYPEGYWERGEGSNYVAYGDDPGWAATARIVAAASPGRALLEVGCAKGFFVKAALEHGMSAVGVDLSRYAVSHPAPKVADLIRVGNGNDLSAWEDDTFDVVCSWEMLEHVPEEASAAVLDEMLRVLKPGGLFVHRIQIWSDDDQHAHDDDETHVWVVSRHWWQAEFAARGLWHSRGLEDRLDATFADRDWAGRFFAWRKPG